MQHRSLAAGLALALAPATPAQQDPAPYPELDAFEGSHVYLAQVPRRPMAVDGVVLYAINNHDSVVQRFDDTSGQPSRTYRVPWNPVAIDVWHDAEDVLHLLVLTAGNDSLTVLRPDTGEIVDVVQLIAPGGERLDGPADLLVEDAGDRAWVSLPPNNAVLELDLSGGSPTPAALFRISGSRPTYLSFDVDGRVLVSPLLSGNATGVHNEGPPGHKGREGVLDLDPLSPTTVVRPGTDGLPDTDVFRLTPGTGQVERAVRDAGTVLFEHKVNPATDELWMLGIESHNLIEGEPNLSGVFASHRLAIVDSPALTAPLPLRPTSTVDLDALLPAPVPPETLDDTSLSMCVALDFSPGGAAAVVATQSNRVAILSSSGAYSTHFDLQEGDLPRAVRYVPALDTILVYCWGSNLVRAFDATQSPPTEWQAFELGHDPTPPKEQAGRALFYDASFSKDANLSCGSCHVDGELDGEVWDLGSEGNLKGEFSTQTLIGIERSQPFHWRGEQKNGLADFNSAFVDLLGHDEELDAESFAAFQAFVFSLTPRANPHQDFWREVRDTVDAPLSPFLDAAPLEDGRAATVGLPQFVTICSGCHSFPIGTNNDFSEEAEFHPHQRMTEVASLTQLQTRAQPDHDASTPLTYDTVEVFFDTAGGANPNLPNSTHYATTGTGISHAGLLQGIHGFIAQVFLLFGNQPDEQLAADLTSFVFQFDEGLAPAVHRTYLLNDASHAAGQVLTDVGDLITQATTPMPQGNQPLYNCDVAVFGVATIGSAQRELAWWYDRDGGATPFVCEDPAVGPHALSFFTGQADAGEGWFVFVGMPTGMGRRFAIDYDDDGLVNLEEASQGTLAYDPDFDGDGMPDGYEVLHASDPLAADAPAESTPPSVSDFEVLWETTRVGKLRWSTSEVAECVVKAVHQTTGHERTVAVPGRATRHSAILPDLLPSDTPGESVYDVRILATDPSGNDNSAGGTQPDGPVAGTLAPDVAGGLAGVRLAELTAIPFVTMSGEPGATVSARIVDRRPFTSDVGAAGYHVVFRVLVNGVRAPAGGIAAAGLPQDFTVEHGGTPTDYDVAIHEPAQPPNDLPWLISPASDANGDLQFGFSLPLASPSDDVELVVELVGDPAPFTPTTAHFRDPHQWSLADTLEEHRSLSF